MTQEIEFPKVRATIKCRLDGISFVPGDLVPEDMEVEMLLRGWAEQEAAKDGK